MNAKQKTQNTKIVFFYVSVASCTTEHIAAVNLAEKCSSKFSGAKRGHHEKILTEESQVSSKGLQAVKNRLQSPCPKRKCLAIKHDQTLFGDQTFPSLDTLFDRV